METKNAKTIHIEHGYDKDAYSYYPILIVGAGEAGIGLGCQLREKMGFDQFRIFDRQSGIGGTWWINRYPGVACDVPIAFYSYSFAPYYNATSIYPSGREIVQYLHRVASKYEIVDKIQLNTDVTDLHWLEKEQLWEATITYMAPGTGDMGEKERQAYIAKNGAQSVYLKQEKVRAKIAISCVGGLVEPKAWPDHIPGSEDFQGELFHTARWKDDAQIKGKDVVLVGTGCSSVQVAQAILDEPFNAKSVTQLMRTPPWCEMKVPEPFGKELFAKYAPSVVGALPILGWLFRMALFAGAELTWFSIFLNKESNEKSRKQAEEKLLKRMKSIAPKEYHEMLTPNYSIGCKRRIFDPSPGWYSCMNDPRFRLTTQTLKSVQPNGVTLSGNQTYPPTVEQDPDAQDEFEPADVIILANGYDMREWLHPLKVYGRGGKSMHDVWRERGGPQAYMCSSMDGFPNFFMICGPNVYTGHSSVVLAVENMIEYTLKMIAPVIKGDVTTVEVKKYAQLDWTAKIQKELKDTVFGSATCTSWYKTESGWNSTSYPRSQIDFALRCLFPKYGDLKFEMTRRGAIKKALGQAARYLSLVFILVAAFWARRSGTSLVDMIRQKLKERAQQLLAILALGIAAAQSKLY